MKNIRPPVLFTASAARSFSKPISIKTDRSDILTKIGKYVDSNEVIDVEQVCN